MAGNDFAFNSMQNSLLLQQQQRYLDMAGAHMKAGAKVTDTDPSRNSSQPGTMYVNDFFTPTSMEEATSPTENPHGIQVARAARQHGFQGPIEGASQHGSPHDAKVSGGRQQLVDGPLNQRDARKAVQSFVSGSAAGLLDSQSQYLDGLTQRGARNSAANISMGTSKASLTRQLYSQASLAWNPDAGMPPQVRAGATQNLENLSTAYGLDSAKLRSQDPKIHGPERQKLQQRLLDHVSQTMDKDPAVAQEKKEWAASVANFESKNNSVVISAGNEGHHIERLQESNGGRPLRAPADVSTNVLENDAVTSVGATRWFNTSEGLKERRANYSSDSVGVDIYASGSLGVTNPNQADVKGTSFASPRVTAAMAELHRQHPGKSSAEIEAMMKEQLSRPLPSGNGTIPVLDYGRTSQFLSQH